MKSFDSSTTNTFLLPLSPVFNPAKEPKSGLATFSLTAPTAGELVYTIYLVSYSDMTTLLNAKTRVANAAGSFTVTSFPLCSGYLLVT